jgi:hypothetical protein
MMAWNGFWPVAEVQMPSNDTVPEMLDVDDVVPLLPPDFELPPQPAATATSAATIAARAANRTARFLL